MCSYETKQPVSMEDCQCAMGIYVDAEGREGVSLGKAIDVTPP